LQTYNTLLILTLVITVASTFFITFLNVFLFFPRFLRFFNVF